MSSLRLNHLKTQIENRPSALQFAGAGVKQDGNRAHLDSPAAGRLHYIDTLRGFACLWVLLLHSYNAAKGNDIVLHSHSFLTGLLFRFFSLGGFGVDLFLVLSGFCLFYPLARKDEVKNMFLDLREYAYRRTRRILPPYYISLAVILSLVFIPTLIGIPLPHFTTVGGLRDIILHLLMIYNFQPDTIESINVPYWSLALEFQLYVIFPLLVFLARRTRFAYMLLTLLMLSCFWQYMAQEMLKVFPHSYVVWYCAVPSRAFEFASGMAAALLIARPKPHQVRIASALCLLIIPAAWCGLHGAHVWLPTTQLLAAGFAAVLIVFSRIPESWFRWPGLVALTFLGSISYSVYLVHMPIFGMLHQQNFHLHLRGGLLMVYDAVRLLAAVGIGYLFYLVAERPFMNRRKPVARPTGALA